MGDARTIAGRAFRSRLFVGSGTYAPVALLQRALGVFQRFLHRPQADPGIRGDEAVFLVFSDRIGREILHFRRLGQILGCLVVALARQVQGIDGVLLLQLRPELGDVELTQLLVVARGRGRDGSANFGEVLPPGLKLVGLEAFLELMKTLGFHWWCPAATPTRTARR